MRYFLDTNVFLYAAGRPHPLKAPCVAVLQRVAQDAIDAVTSTEVLQEILHRFWSTSNLPQGLMLARLAVDQVAGEVLPVTLAVMQRAFALAERYAVAITIRDAVHAATMLQHGITHIISADRHFDAIGEVTRIDPARAEW